MTLVEWTVVSLLALGVSGLFYMGWAIPRGSRGKDATLKERLAVKREIENLDLRMDDLTDRFKRFQNRENMRGARSQKDLMDEAADILAGGDGNSPAVLPSPAPRLSLFRQRTSRDAVVPPKDRK